jgi:hypothetical protein
MANEPKRTTTYVVLELVTLAGIGQGWLDVGQYEATGAHNAVNQHKEAHGIDSGTFVPVPMRSFQPLTVVPEQVTKTKLVPYAEPPVNNVAAPEPGGDETANDDEAETRDGHASEVLA